MTFGIYGAYFGSLRIILSILLPLVSSGFLYGIFRKSTNPRARSWSLGLMLLSSITLWLFIAMSLVFCYAFAEAYEYELEGAVTAVFGRAVLISIASAIPLSLLLRHYSPRVLLRKVGDLYVPREETAASFSRLAKQMGVPSAELQLSKGNMPISFAVHTDRAIVVMSESLLSLLNSDEIAAVMAHELAHIKNSDTTLKALVTAYRTALPHDPMVRLVEAAFHREREMVADETAVRVTKKPLSLASALLKIYEAFPRGSLGSHGTLSILGASSTLMSRRPPILHRINRLIHVSENYR